MILNATDVVLAMSEGHDEALFAHACHFEAVRKAFHIDHPRVVAAHFKRLAQAFEEIVVARYGDGCCYTMIDVAEVCQCAAEHFAEPSK